LRCWLKNSQKKLLREGLMALPSFFYQDPAKVIEIIESSSCKGCLHEIEMTVFRETFLRCNLKKTHGQKCRQYKEKKGRTCQT